jgi:hypothetical protein
VQCCALRLTVRTGRTEWMAYLCPKRANAGRDRHRNAWANQRGPALSPGDTKRPSSWLGSLVRSLD